MSQTSPSIGRRAAVAGIVGAALAPAALAQQARIAPRPPRQVLGFYYGWYANPAFSDHWAHWPGPTGKEAPAEKPNFNTPELGLYDSHDPKTVAQHALWARQAGLTGVISGGWAKDAWTDRSTQLVLDAMGAQGLKVSVYLEAQKGGQAGAEADLLFLTTQRATHAAWLKVGPRPVIFLYAGALRDLPAAGWRKAAKAVAAAGHPEPILVGDLDPQTEGFAAEAAPLDGTHMYMPTAFMAGRTPAEVEAFAAGAYPLWKKKAAGKIQCATVMPGYNDTKVPGRPLPRPIVDRYGTDMLAASWRAAIKASPDWVLVTSFNAWNDGTEIEPSRQWGRLTLDANRSWAERFLKS